ncbi:hypothetical protein NUACC21_03640 [Scytonema sp. NUACC21]
MEDLTGLGKFASSAVELWKESGIKEAIKTIFGPAAEKVGLLLADEIDNIRYKKNALKAVSAILEVKEKIDQRKIQVIPPSDETFIQGLENVPLKEDENLRKKWIELLLYEISGEEVKPV